MTVLFAHPIMTFSLKRAPPPSLDEVQVRVDLVRPVNDQVHGRPVDRRYLLVQALSDQLYLQ